MVGDTGRIGFAYQGLLARTQSPSETLDTTLADTVSTSSGDSTPETDDHSSIIAGDQRGGEANGRNQVFLNNSTHNGQSYGQARSARQGSNGTTDQNIAHEVEAIQEDLGRFDGHEGVDVSYTIQSGDTLTDVAQGVLRANTDNLDGDESSLDGAEVGRIRDAIMAKNGITNAGAINVGDELDLTGIVSRLPSEAAVAAEEAAEAETTEGTEPEPEVPDPATFDAQIDGANQLALSALDGSLGALNEEERAYIRGELAKGISIDQLVATGNLLEPATLDNSTYDLSEGVEAVIGDSTNLRDLSDHNNVNREEFAWYRDSLSAASNPELVAVMEQYFNTTGEDSISRSDVAAAEHALTQGFTPEHIVSLLNER
ncbi:MAG: LysM domain-containing protein [Vampirovibrionales bacterium]|nr:LysM domain-containing protein [Vampirovibrionales bacterium]